MENNKATPLWDQNAEPPKTLRPPKAALDLNPKNETKPAVKSELSALAPEWYPANYQPSPPAPSNPIPQNRSSVQDRLKRPKTYGNDARQEFRSSDTRNDHTNEIGSPDMQRLEHIITTLTNDPGQFNELLDLFMDTLFPYFDNIIVLSSAAELLVDRAITQQNFRYTAARLCCSVEEESPEFRSALHLKCQKELTANPNKQGLLMFVAELYTQLHHENIYGSYLIDAFKQLLNDGGNDNVKCICQALKLTGPSLELYNKQALDEVIAQLQSKKTSVTGTALSLLNSVLNLRNSHWGQANTTTASSDQNEEGPTWSEPTTTVFYDTEGCRYRFTAEETEFLAANINPNEDYAVENDSDPDELYDPEPEMDEEIQEAFKEFVKYSKR